jgi:2-polyprenyl-6-hydroxyphenyl methylase/3-demethylubiquinone-9 3-methyltransferase
MAMDETKLDSHFGFGENWSKLVNSIDDRKLESAITDITSFVGNGLENKSFLDIGCGSGLSSLAAYKMGAASITSVDIDPLNINNTNFLKNKFNVPETFPWNVKITSIVSNDDVKDLPKSDVVYSWGVLHHTGAMWSAITNTISLVNPEGLLYLMLYRDAHLARVWKWIKWFYVKSPKFIKYLIRNIFAGIQIFGIICKGKNPLKVINEYGNNGRGMSWFIDSTDWFYDCQRFSTRKNISQNYP